ncbi:MULTISPECIES: HNH endonuclease signature motif containing protein [unclassified Sphingomonas]
MSPYRGDPNDDVRNGLLLRSDLHTLFDLMLLWIDEQMCVRVRQDMKSTA